MARLNGDLESLLAKQGNTDNEVIEVQMDGGKGW
jgi:hypothetical protein